MSGGVGHDGCPTPRAWFRGPFGDGIVDGMSPRAVSFIGAGPLTRPPCTLSRRERGCGDESPGTSSSTRSHRMTHGPPMKFTKMHGIGNDYVYVEPLRPAGPGRPRGGWRSRSATGTSGSAPTA